VIGKVPFLSPESSTTCLGYGTTSLLGVDSTRARLSLLEIAYDAGIRHFDTAPYYGYGEAERLLGDFLEGRENVTVTTKFGIGAPSVVKNRNVNLLARRVIKLFPFLRRAASRKAQSLSRRGAFTVPEARQSLENSLFALRRDFIDLLLLHEPTIEAASSRELIDFLSSELQKRRIRGFGCGGDFHILRAIAQCKPEVSRHLQFEDDVAGNGIAEGKRLGAQCITFRTFQKVLPQMQAWLDNHEQIRKSWSKCLDVDLKKREVLADMLQALGHFRNPSGIMLFSSRIPGRVRRAAEVATGGVFSRDQLKEFDTLLGKVAGQIGA